MVERIDTIVLCPANKRWPLNDDGVWIELRRSPLARPGPVLFLDRDGVIIEDRGYIGDPTETFLVTGAADLIRMANDRNVPVAVVTNQSGIDRGLFGWRDFDAVTKRLDELLRASGARIDAIAACPFHPDFTSDYQELHSRWRKPGPMMITEIGTRMKAVFGMSWMVGDNPRDMEAARAAGIERRFLVSNDIAPTGSNDSIVLANVTDVLAQLSKDL